MKSERVSTVSILKKHRERFIFHGFRGAVRFKIAPIFFLFCIPDYLYIHQYWTEGLVLRALWVALIFASFEALKVRKFRSRYCEVVPIIDLALACSIVNWMIFRSGGYSSLYITGLILVNVTGLEMIKFPRRQAVIVNLLCCLPALGIIAVTAGKEHWIEGLTQAIFIAGLTSLASGLPNFRRSRIRNVGNSPGESIV